MDRDYNAETGDNIFLRRTFKKTFVKMEDECAQVKADFLAERDKVKSEPLTDGGTMVNFQCKWKAMVAIHE